MQHPTSRPRRVRRVIAISAAAVAVMIAPTACDYGGPAQMDMTGHSGHMDGMNMDEPVQEHQVVQVGNTRSSAPTTDEAAAATASTAEAQRVASERRGGDDGRRGEDDRRRGEDRRGGGRGNQTTIPAPATGTGTGTATATATGSATATASTSASATGAPAAPTGPNNGLDVLGRDCSNSKLTAHTGFQSADPQCVSTAMGEVAPENQLPSLLITNSPRQVGVNQPFKLVVSTRNLVRDRFLGAAAGGYYLESSFLNGQKLQRGHFHTACRMLSSLEQAPDSAPAPAFFLATQDNGGGKRADSVTIDVPASATKTAGVMQCTSWAGDGSHRTPMMSRANQTPAIDSVRIFVSGRDRAEQEDVSALDAQADATQQAQAEEQQAVAQKPDPGGDAAANGAAADTAAPAEVPAVADPATEAAEPAESAAPSAN
jgi:hypothetical protein